MDTSLALLTAQLQQKFDLMEAKTTDKVAQNETNQELITLQQKYQALEQTYHNLKNENVILQRKLSVVEIAMTAHPVFISTKSGIIKFDNVRFSVGINDLSAYKSTGKFTCETVGIYLISAAILSNTNGARYYIYLNGNPISDTHIGYSSSSPSAMYHTSTVVRSSTTITS
ncbi:unnamed protein product [Mytilus coruscus]|uniref:C1q domain-containing protein n=1 Tax=Mytilus coruscus TaxID=42192 RepID=A0A6J8BY93_MYTCO|nr:unnamed protein product [Mytilus coruscus]